MGKLTPLASWIRTDDALIFEPPYPGIRKRTEAPRILTGHWTGGEGGAASIFRTLQTRVDPETGEPSPLSVQFVIDGDGEAWQFCDLDRVVCFHAGAVNDFSLGVEITNRGLAPALTKRDRPVVRLKVHGRVISQLAYTAKQLDTWCRLADLVAEHYGIPKQVPGNADGTVADRVMSRAERAAWRGVGEHLHFATKKSDGGTQLSRALIARGYAAVDPAALVKEKR